MTSSRVPGMSWSRVPPKSKGSAGVVVEAEAVPEPFLVAILRHLNIADAEERQGRWLGHGGISNQVENGCGGGIGHEDLGPIILFLTSQ